ncbi:hypothetical protein CKO09_11760 [Chromatium weissei]|nr:hypothetical protein [Chromatium weissei]
MTPRYPLARLSPAKDTLLVITISHESIVTGNLQPILAQLLSLSASTESALQWEGCLTVVFEGWDDDPRETAQIPEIRTYFRNLTEAWPYWWHYSEKVGDTFGHILRLLCSGQVVAVGGMMGWRFTDMAEVSREVMGLFAHLNRLHADLGLDASMNERISQEIAQLIGVVLQ